MKRHVLLTQHDQDVLNQAQEHVEQFKDGSAAFLIVTGKGVSKTYRVSDLLSIIRKYQAATATIISTE